MFHASALSSALLALVLTATVARANPEPDIPVRCRLAGDGSCMITVEIDPRCFTAEPMTERYMMKADLVRDTAAELDAVKKRALDAISQWLEFAFEPAAAAAAMKKPEFAAAFTGLGGAVLVMADDPVVVTATWRFQFPADVRTLRVRAAKAAPFAVVVRQIVDGVEQRRFATLFPGEMSFAMTRR